MFARTAWLVLRKDLLVEVRSREVALTAAFFALSCVMIFAFAFVRDGRAVDGVAAGILWSAIAFAGTVALGRAFEREREGATLAALLLAPADRAAVYTGKLLSMLALLAGLEALLLPLVALLFGTPLLAHLGLHAALLAAGTIGFAAVGTLFAAMLLRARGRGVLLPVLLYPIVIPVLIGGVQGTAAIWRQPSEPDMAVFWLGLLAFFDVVFVTLALWTFDPLVTE